jgi:hypothetical protein
MTTQNRDITYAVLNSPFLTAHAHPLPFKEVKANVLKVKPPEKKTKAARKPRRRSVK